MLFSNDEHSEGYDAVLLGQASPSPINVDGIDDLLNRGNYLRARESLLEVGFGNNWAQPGGPVQDVVVDLLGTFAGQGSDLRPWAKTAQINRDRNLRLQYLAGMWFNSYQSTRILQSILTHYRFPSNVFTGSKERIVALKQALSYSGRVEK